MGFGFPATCVLYHSHNLLWIWVWSVLSPPPPSITIAIFMMITQNPRVPSEACWETVCMLLTSFPLRLQMYSLAAVSSSRKKFWQGIMLNSTRDIFHLPPWRSGLWVGNGPWHSYTLWFSAGPHNSHCDVWCVPGELCVPRGHVKCKTWKGNRSGVLCKTNQASLKGLAF